MGVDALGHAAAAAGHGAAELVHVELGDDTGQQRQRGFALEVLFGVGSHVEPHRPCGAEHHVGPVQRLVGGGQRIGEAGQGFALFLVHGEHGDVLADEIAPPLGVGLDDEAGTQGQHHRHACFAGITHRGHGRVLHRGAIFTTHQVGGDDQGGGLLDDGLGDVGHIQMVHLAGVDAEAALAPSVMKVKQR